MTKAAMLKQQRTAGLVTGSAVAAYVLCSWLTPTSAPWISAAVVSAIVGSGLLMLRWWVPGRIVATLSLLGFVAATVRPVLSWPAAALSIWLAVGWILAQLWLIPGLPPDRRLSRDALVQLARTLRARSTLRMTAVASLLAAFSASDPSAGDRIAITLALGVGAWFVHRARPLPLFTLRRAAVLILVALMALVSLVTTESGAEFALLVLATTCVATALLTRPPRRVGVVHPAWWERLLEHPARQLVASFFALIVLGALLLALPLASPDPAQPSSLVDAAFTSVSAVCVTGLIVRDTPVDWSGFGLGTILVLIQLGGLGIMTFATAFLGAIGRRLSLRQESAVAELAGNESRLLLYGAVQRVLKVTFTAEAIGTIVLTLRFFAHGESFGAALWRGLFTAVSAFCNAGFSLQTDSLIGYAADPIVLHTVAALIVLGGISPAVVVALPAWGRRRRLPLQARLILNTTAILLCFGTALIAATEWNNTLDGMGLLAKWNNAWFQSVTLRTAGFNSIDFSLLRPATVTLSLLWMFIGGSPGGTAGGAKTTTVAVLLLAVYASVRGQREIRVFGRAVPHASVYRAASVVTLGLTSLVLVMWSLQLTQDIAPVPTLFETVSALGTVGLSMGATPHLDDVGKIIVMIAMFVGRVGSLTLFVFLLARREPSVLHYPQEPVDCG
jgi:trk system potassium uptake protein TrkH